MKGSELATEARAPRSKERVLRAGVALAVRDGSESLTMRKLADELGVGAISLYHHVPNTSTASPSRRRACRSTPPRKAQPSRRSRSGGSPSSPRSGSSPRPRRSPPTSPKWSPGTSPIGYDFTAAFEHGLDLILDALEKRRDTA